MKNLWAWASSLIATITIGLALLYFVIYAATAAIIDQPESAPTEIIVHETPPTPADLELADQQETKKHLRQYKDYWERHANCNSE